MSQRHRNCVKRVLFWDLLIAKWRTHRQTHTDTHTRRWLMVRPT